MNQTFKKYFNSNMTEIVAGLKIESNNKTRGSVYSELTD